MRDLCFCVCSFQNLEYIWQRKVCNAILQFNTASEVSLYLVLGISILNAILSFLEQLEPQSPCVVGAIRNLFSW